jgi:hypothetical protein
MTHTASLHGCLGKSNSTDKTRMNLNHKNEAVSESGAKRYAHVSPAAQFIGRMFPPDRHSCPGPATI